MKYLTTLPITNIVDTYLNSGKFTLSGIYAQKNKMFIEHLIALYATYPLVRNKDNLISMSKTFFALPEEHVTSEGTFTKQQLIDYLWVCSKLPRSVLVSKMGEYPLYGSLTPLFMYAHKKFNGVKYSEWDNTDTHINIALGLFLGKAMDFNKKYPHIQLDTTAMLRKSLANGNVYTKYIPNLSYTSTMDPVDGEAAESIKYPREWLIMHMQFWLANESKRNSSYMLLDTHKFGIVPKALDAPVISSSAREMI